MRIRELERSNKIKNQVKVKSLSILRREGRPLQTRQRTPRPEPLPDPGGMATRSHGATAPGTVSRMSIFAQEPPPAPWPPPHPP